MLTTTTRRVILLACLCFASSSFADDEAKPKLQTQTQGDAKRVFDFKITPEMKTADLDNPKSALSKLIAYIVKGDKPATDYVSVQRTGNTPELNIKIKDDSIFVPGGNLANKQNGFRRTDVNAAIDVSTTLTGVTTFYQSIRLDPKAPLVLKHGYLLASIEAPSGDHVFDIFTGSDFESTNVENKETKNSKTIRVRDWARKTIYDLPYNMTTNYNFAIQVDWTANTLTVYASTNTDPLKMVAGPVMNDPKVVSPEFVKKGEYHLQLIKFPLVDASVPVEKRGDVPHFGLQEKIIKEHVFFSNVYVTSGKGIQQPIFNGSGNDSKRHRCRI